MTQQREIKFRIWDGNKMWEPATIQKMMDAATIPNTNALVIEELRGKWGKVEFMQFTGLYDKAGTPIYEGDIVYYESIKKHPKKCAVEYVSEAGAFLLVEKGSTALNVFIKYLGDIIHDQSDTRTYHLCEVIGNVYSNPELLS